MCGICGFFGDGTAVSSDTLERMNSTLVRRGPDDSGVWGEPGVGLAMRRLSIIDLQGGRVVRGVAGRRDQYRPIVSQLVSSSSPGQLARALILTFLL